MKSSSEIGKICREYGIGNYTINDDGSIDVDGDINLYKCELTEFPLNFNRVTGYFDCNGNYLTTLKGSPKYVGSSFYCSDNELTSLEYSPIEVEGTFSCRKNKLTSLEHSPRKVEGHFIFSENNIRDLYGISDNIGGELQCYHTPLDSIFYSGFIKLDIDFIKRFNSYKIIKDGKVVLKRLKYVMEAFDMEYDLNRIQKQYTII